MGRSRQLKIHEPDAEHLLDARLDVPVGQRPHAYALFAHCFTCNKNFKAVRQISRALTQAGIAVLSFDFTGLGGSEGDFAETNFTTNVRDLMTAAQYLEEEYQSPALLIGHSLGGAAILYAASQLEAVQAAVTIGAPSDIAHVKELFAAETERIRREGGAEVLIGGRPFTIKQHFLDDIADKDLEQVVKSLRKSLLILHSPQDLTVSIEHAARLYHWAHHPKSFITLDGADHILRDQADGAYVGQVIASWAARYLPLSDAAEPVKTSSQVAVRLHRDDGFTTDISAGGFALIADEPVAVGGNDLGPSPYQLLLSSLGTCTVMTLHMYARRKKWPLTEVVVHLNYDRVHCHDAECLDEDDKYLHQFQAEVELSGDLTDQQRQRLLEIAKKCPVHKTLKGQIEIQSSLKGK